jgi:hypothetical protein
MRRSGFSKLRSLPFDGTCARERKSPLVLVFRWICVETELHRNQGPDQQKPGDICNDDGNRPARHPVDNPEREPASQCDEHSERESLRRPILVRLPHLRNICRGRQHSRHKSDRCLHVDHKSGSETYS